MITPLFNGILFVFFDKITGGYFQEKTNWDFRLTGEHKNSSKSGRWGKVLAIGPDVSNDIQTGDNIFITPLMWTQGIKHDGIEVWKTDETHILLVEH